MIQELSLDNFKAFKNLNNLQIKPLTIIVGKNSCGKSSILHSLLLLKQTLESSYRTNTLELEGNYLKYSNLKEICYGQPHINKAEFGYTFCVKVKNHNNEYQLKHIKLYFKNKKINDSNTIVVSKLTIDSDDGTNSKNLLKISKKDVAKTFLFKKKTMANINSKINIKFNHFFPEYIELDIESNDNDEKQAFKRLPYIVLDNQDSFLSLMSLRNELKNIKYLSPTRAVPQRAYVHYSQSDTELLQDGSNSAHILWLNRLRKVKYKNKSLELTTALNECLDIVGLKQNISPHTIGNVLYKVNVKEQYTGGYVSLADVGFGYSQVIPIILMGLLADEQSMVLIEQPEIHLHPSSAANLADLFLSFIDDNDKRFIIETHSQEFIHRLRLRIIENPNLGSLINIVFVEESDEGAKIKQFQIDKDGMFPEWPEGFLDESERLAEKILYARIKNAESSSCHIL